jgi:hypothetical protein
MYRIIVLAWDERLRSATYLRPTQEWDERMVIIPYIIYGGKQLGFVVVRNNHVLTSIRQSVGSNYAT